MVFSSLEYLNNTVVGSCPLGFLSALLGLTMCSISFNPFEEFEISRFVNILAYLIIVFLKD